MYEIKMSEELLEQYLKIFRMGKVISKKFEFGFNNFVIAYK